MGIADSISASLGLNISDTGLDAKTIWLFREQLTNAKVIRSILDDFEHGLEAKGLVTHTGTIMDAPRQYNHWDENDDIKAENVPAEWQKPEKINKLRQKDTDARWAKKNQETHYGYKEERENGLHKRDAWLAIPDSSHSVRDTTEVHHKLAPF